MLDEEHGHAVVRQRRSADRQRRRSRLRRALTPARRGGGPWVGWRGPGPSSTSRARPVGSESARSSATLRRPTRSRISLGLLHRTGRAVVGPAFADLGRCLDVLASGERTEHLEPLKGPRHAEVRSLVSASGGDVVALERDLPGGRRLQPGDHIERRGLARTVRPDEAGDPALIHAQADLVHGHVPAEADADLSRLQNRHHTPPQPARARDRALGSVQQ